MSNCEIFNLPVLEVEPHHVREVLRCLLHTIIFNRALGHVQPVEIDSELFDVTYVQCGDPEVDNRLEAKITEFCHFTEKRSAGEIAQLCLSFYERKRRNVNWFGRQEERLCWEQWCINISVTQADIASYESSSMAYAQARSQRMSKAQRALEELMTLVVRFVNDKKDHIPPVVSSSTITFPFEISISGGPRSAFGLQVVKRMLLHTSPPPVLS